MKNTFPCLICMLFLAFAMFGCTLLDDCASKSDLPSTDRIDCYYTHAIERQDASYCEKIQYAGFRDTCYMKLSGIKHDDSLCAKIMHPRAREACYG